MVVVGNVAMMKGVQASERPSCGNDKPSIEDLCDAVVDHLAPTVSDSRRGVVALAGSVAVGKSTLSEELARCLSKRGLEATVVSTDGFLLPNRVLGPLGLAFVKGLPQTYDWAALRSFACLARDAQATLLIPVYSHVSFDADATGCVGPGRMVIVEGINALHPLAAGLADVSIYLDAPDETIANWYVSRFVRLIEAAETNPASFYCRFVDLDESDRIEVARSVWDGINLPNLQHHIAPTKSAANIVVTLTDNHVLSRIEAGTATSESETA